MSESSQSAGPNKKLTIPTLITLVAVVIMFALGLWQLQRAEEKHLRLMQMAERQAEADMTLRDVLQTQGDVNDINFIAQGRLDTERFFLIDNKIHQGQVGYHVVVPLFSNQGTILVNLGWIKAGLSRNSLPAVALPNDMVRVRGMASVPTHNVMIKETAKEVETWPLRLQQIDLTVMSAFLERPLVEFIMLLDKEDPRGFERDWQPVVMPPGKHIAYAVQWFVMAIAALLVYLFAVRARNKKDND